MMSSNTNTNASAGASTNATNDGDVTEYNGPQRFIYTQADMEHFRHSTARKELLSFVTAMGRGLTETTSGNDSPSSTPFPTPSPLLPHNYSPQSPLLALTPALASLHGSLTCMSSTWLDPNHIDGIPPDRKAKARFGNPAFRTWHERLVERSEGIVGCLMDCHLRYSGCLGGDGEEHLTMEKILDECSRRGYEAASGTTHEKQGQNDQNTISNSCPTPSTSSPPSSSQKEKEIITELRAYLHDSFGHPIRIDYGTGHESSFVVFLLALCKIGCFSWNPGKPQASGKSVADGVDGADGAGSVDAVDAAGVKSKSNPSPKIIGRASLSLFHAYLKVTRGLQNDYMLEPAGSHGVWGLDDYHCVPFYLGACQMVARDQWQKQQKQQQKHTGQQQHPLHSQEMYSHLTHKRKQHPKQGGSDMETSSDGMSSNSYLPKQTLPQTSQINTSTSADDTTTETIPDINTDLYEPWSPSSIHSPPTLHHHRHTYLYFSLIHFIQQIKPNVPFFESSPMLNDISQLSNWSKVASGLIRLYEGEVLEKLPVVQHFVFGKIFRAEWKPSRREVVAPKWTFVNGLGGEECIAPWALEGVDGGGSGGGSGGAGVGTGGAAGQNAVPGGGGQPPTNYPGGVAPTRAPWAK